ncbi:hypothetical protein QR685DRAFT_519712 [Neurospora intermedia]|uniref:Secreted protein n=1 Tax=Neurospora intermedia TaxID=5142 RepID=A0ABR3DG37_NEUIN
MRIFSNCITFASVVPALGLHWVASRSAGLKSNLRLPSIFGFEFQVSFFFFATQQRANRIRNLPTTFVPFFSLSVSHKP